MTATAPSAHASSPELSARRGDLLLAISLIDLTSLDPLDTPDRVRALCRRATSPAQDVRIPGGAVVPPVAAVCVWPTLVGGAREDLAGSPLRLATVAGGFPAGQVPTAVKVLETRRAVEAGADEIDLTINRAMLLVGRDDSVADEVRDVKQACAGRTLKVILETGELADSTLIRRACVAAIAGGADFLKTSTGKSAVGATPESVRVLLEAVRDEFRRSGRVVGVKPSGGVRTAAQALAYLNLVREVMGDEAGRWLRPEAFRFGASALLDDLVGHIAGDGARPALEIDPIGPDDAGFVRGQLIHHWLSTDIRSRGHPFDAMDLPGFIARLDGRPVGHLVFHVEQEGMGRNGGGDGGELEVVTLASAIEGRGVGSALLEAAAGEARRRGCRRMFLTTSNDNLRALRFYQRRGWRLVAVHRGMMDRYREERPAIPRVGMNGIPLRDEIELEMPLGV